MGAEPTGRRRREIADRGRRKRPSRQWQPRWRGRVRRRRRRPRRRTPPARCAPRHRSADWRTAMHPRARAAAATPPRFTGQDSHRPGSRQSDMAAPVWSERRPSPPPACSSWLTTGLIRRQKYNHRSAISAIQLPPSSNRIAGWNRPPPGPINPISVQEPLRLHSAIPSCFPYRAYQAETAHRRLQSDASSGGGGRWRSRKVTGLGHLPGAGWRFASQMGIIPGISGTGPYRQVLASTGFRPE